MPSDEKNKQSKLTDDADKKDTSAKQDSQSKKEPETVTQQAAKERAKKQKAEEKASTTKKAPKKKKQNKPKKTSKKASKDDAEEPSDNEIAISKRTLTITATIAILLVLAAGIAVLFQSQPDNEVLATVNNVPITSQEVTTRANLLNAIGQPVPSEDQIQDLLIEEQLVLEAAKDQDIEVNRDEAQQRLQADLNSSGVTEADYRSGIESRGTTWADLITYYQTQVTVQRVIDEELGDTTVTEEDLREAYEENTEQFTIGAQAEVRHILISTENTTQDDAESQAEAIARAVRDDATTFCSYVNDFSDDTASIDDCGAYNVTANSQFVAEFREAALNMSVDEVRVVETQFGYHVIQKTGERPARQLSLSEVEVQLRANLEQQQRAQAIQNYVAGLRDEYSVTVGGEPQQPIDADPEIRENTSENQTRNETLCAQDVRQCPDGSYVGRNPDNNCAFYDCPTTENQTQTVEQETYENLASCIAERDATLYLVSWCPECQDQLNIFEDTSDLDIVDCDEERRLCEQAGVENYPTWIIDEEEYVGYQSPTKLSSVTGCEI